MTHLKDKNNFSSRSLPKYIFQFNILQPKSTPENAETLVLDALTSHRTVNLAAVALPPLQNASATQ